MRRQSQPPGERTHQIKRADTHLHCKGAQCRPRGIHVAILDDVTRDSYDLWLCRLCVRCDIGVPAHQPLDRPQQNVIRRSRVKA
jgi:hypothetical protein